ncbi:hypothetical protein [Psychrobacter sp. P2G3]|uniref:hypothetical protein n=1 Tax=Psychrobacter sp. P2G3 TaxID=1699622 RepID=UPI00078BDADA|nr:hypothetical protein [Psychrobacter sp. P2G3]AMN50650.1 hypothetical protein AK823_12920 [Psychrobacter sp. P2G3]
MKNIMINSILAASACLAMVNQANAAPNFNKHHTAQVQHQKVIVKKVDAKHKHVKNKATVSRHKSNRIAAAQSAKSKHKDIHEHRS